MANLARTKPRPPVRSIAAPPPPNKTKILLVRQPVKSVRRADEPDRTALRLAIGVITALGIVGVVWLMGYLGWRLGFAPMMRVPDLRIEGSGGIATGTLMLIGLPRVILEAGIAQPMWLMAGFALICVPAASLGAIKPPVRGGPRPKAAIMVLLYTGAIFAMINAIALLWWTVSPFRNQFVTELPFRPDQTAAWLDNMRIVGGLDALAVIAAALWVVVAMRVAVPLWLRALASSVCLFVLVVLTVAFSISNATITQLMTDRSVFLDDEGSLDPQLVVGFTPEYLVTLGVERTAPVRRPSTQPAFNSAGDPTDPDLITVVEMTDRSATLSVYRRQSIIDFLRTTSPPLP